MRSCLGSLAAACLLAGCAAPPPDTPARRAAVVAEASAARVRADMLALSSDAMEGRATGTPGHARAAQWVADRFGALGLQPPPLAAATPYWQSIDFVESRLERASLQLQTAGGPIALAYPADFVGGGGFGELTQRTSADLVFAGYGIEAPELGHDDYAGLDVRGKFLVLFSGAPPRFGNGERAHYSSLDAKQALAEAKGARGLLMVQTPVDRKRSPWLQLVSQTRWPSLRWRRADGQAQDGHAQLPTVTLSPVAAERLLAAQGQSLDTLFERYFAGQTQGFALPGAAATLERHSIQGRLQSPNVLALLPGRDPQLRHEIVLVSAHLDHLGIDPAASADRIYNGAYDNAAGVAVMLELARLLQPLQGLRRSLVFVAFTAEEQGMRGSDYLAQHPPWPGTRIVANLNIDMPYLGHPIRDLQGYGAAHSSLEDALAQAAAENGLSLGADPHPELVRLIRSDQYAFVRRGIPGLNLKPGTTSGDPTIDGAALQQDYLARHYHRPSDDASLPWNPDAATRYTRAAATLALLLTQAEAAPRWREGDFFGRLYAPPRRP